MSNLTGQQVKDLRTKYGVKQVELAKYMCCSQNTIHRIERGDKKIESFEADMIDEFFKELV